jgi:hypothetical protein
LNAAVVADPESANVIFRILGVGAVRRTTMLCCGTDEVCGGTHDALATWVKRHYVDFGLAAREITDEDMRHIAYMTQLRCLTVESRWITSTGVKELRKCKSLKCVRIGSPLLDDRALDTFVTLRSLKRLELVGTNVSKRGLTTLRSTRPDMQIFTIRLEWRARRPESTVRSDPSDTDGPNIQELEQLFREAESDTY